MVRNMFVNILAMVAVVLFAATALAGEREVPRATEMKVFYNDDFLPPHIEAGIELERVRQGDLPQTQEIVILYILEQQKKQDREEITESE